MRVKIKVTGIVQGVGFRPFIYRLAVKNALTGYVRNRGDAGVEILAEGAEKNIESFLLALKQKKPAIAQIHNVVTIPLSTKRVHKMFKIHRSSEETEFSGSIIPPDLAICNHCRQELRNQRDPRNDYFFITCTNCGPRFTLINQLPYDRENTTMQTFPMCSFCKKEYQTPINRRFHAQTIACPKCGPRVYLASQDGELIQHTDPVREAGRLISEGHILAIKGYGGFHISTSTTKQRPLTKLRKAKHRKQKPFAVMARSVDATRTFAKVTLKEEELLTSYTRPIVLLNKNSNFPLSELIAPSLHNIGTMLPYTGLHYMLFDQTNDTSFVMTSANPPNQPIVKSNQEALKKLGSIVDYFLFHNRAIAYRCDDSVVRLHGNHPSFIRRSRGYVPVPLILTEKTERCVVALGGELNNTSCVLLNNKAFISQHIGDVENLETRAFLLEATNRLVRLTNCQPDTIVCDLHPKFVTTNLAQELAERNNWRLVRLQHHHAHSAALMLEHDVDEIITIVCDGYGYGVDGTAWGGEIFLCTRQSAEFKRIAHLEEQPLLGGDAATRYPTRMAAGILNKKLNVEDWLAQNSQYLPHGVTEAQVLLQQLRKGDGVPKTTSCGRVLDAVSAVLGICNERTYEGEPAIKLESIAKTGKNTLKIEPVINGSILDTTHLLVEIFKNRDEQSKADLAYVAHDYLARGLASIAIQKALENKIKTIGFSGGAASNEILSSTMRKIVEEVGLRFLVHKKIPPGDGCVSFGQAVVGGFF